MSTEIGNLSNLTQLALFSESDKVYLNGNIPTEIGNLKSLKNLVLHDNNLSGSIPTEIGKLSDLNALFLYQNKLSGSIPTEISNLSNLNNLTQNGSNGGLLLNNNCLSIDSNGITAIKSLDVYNNPKGGIYNFNNNCIDIDALNGVTETNCINCHSQCNGNDKPNNPCKNSIDDILFPVLPDPEPKPKYRTVYNNRTGCFTICKKK